MAVSFEIVSFLCFNSGCSVGVGVSGWVGSALFLRRGRRKMRWREEEAWRAVVVVMTPNLGVVWAPLRRCAGVVSLVPPFDCGSCHLLLHCSAALHSLCCSLTAHETTKAAHLFVSHPFMSTLQKRGHVLLGSNTPTQVSARACESPPGRT